MTGSSYGEDQKNSVANTSEDIQLLSNEIPPAVMLRFKNWKSLPLFYPVVIKITAAPYPVVAPVASPLIVLRAHWLRFLGCVPTGGDLKEDSEEYCDCFVLLFQSEIILLLFINISGRIWSWGLYLETREEPFKLPVVEMGRGGISRLVIPPQQRLFSF